jgi:hypothetical protein
LQIADCRLQTSGPQTSDCGQQLSAAESRNGEQAHSFFELALITYILIRTNKYGYTKLMDYLKIVPARSQDALCGAGNGTSGDDR